MDESRDDSIYILGHEILQEFGEKLFELLETELRPRWGDNWLELCLTDEEKIKRISERDLHFLLKQILDRNNQNFRMALAKSLCDQTKLTKEMLDQFEQVQRMRNLWAHPTSIFTSKDLKKLVKAIYEILGGSHSLGSKCFQIWNLPEGPELSNKVASFSKVFSQNIGFVENLIGDVQKKEATIFDLRQMLGMIKNSSECEPGSIEYLMETEDIRGQLTMAIHMWQDMYLAVQRANLESMKFQIAAIELYSRTKRGKSTISKEDIIWIRSNGEEFVKHAKEYATYAGEVKEEREVEECDCIYCTKITKHRGPIVDFGSEFQRKLKKIAEGIHLT